MTKRRYNDTTSVAVVLYSQDAFLALPKDKKEAKVAEKTIWKFKMLNIEI